MGFERLKHPQISLTTEHKYLGRYLKMYVNTSSGVYSCCSNAKTKTSLLRVICWNFTMYLLVTCLELIYPNIVISDYLERTKRLLRLGLFTKCMRMDDYMGRKVEILVNFIFPSFEARNPADSSAGQDNWFGHAIVSVWINRTLQNGLQGIRNEMWNFRRANGVRAEPMVEREWPKIG